MDKVVTHEVHCGFRRYDDFFSGLGADTVAAMASAGSDISLVVSSDGEILDVSYRDRVFKQWGVDDWTGRPWREVVTVESRDKVDELLQEATRFGFTRARQVNHASASARDLPVNYRVMAIPGRDARLVLGDDLRVVAEMQQRLVRAQVEMEKDYRKLRDVESRYRILFHLAYEPLIVVDAFSMRILDANEGAARLFDKSAKKLAGSPVSVVFSRSDQALATEALIAIAARGRDEAFQARPATQDAEMDVRVTPFRELGKTNLLICFANKDEPKHAGGLSMRANLVFVAENLPDGIVLVNGEGAVIEANPAFLDLIRVVSMDRIEGKGLDNWLGGSNVDLQVLMANLREHGTVRRFSSVVRDELGGSESVEVSAARINGGDGPLFGFAIRETSRSEAGHSGMNGIGGHRTAAEFTELVGRVPLKDLVRDTADIIEKLCIEAALRLTDNNRASAADMLGLSRQSLYIKLKRYGISDPDADEE